MTILPDLSFRIIAQASTAAAFAATKAEVAAVRGEMAGLATLGRTFLTSFVAGVGIAGVAQVAHAVGDVVEHMRDLADSAEKIGVTTRALQELQVAAREFQIDDETLTKGIGEFSKRLADAAAGGGELLPILKANGVALRDQSGRMIPVLEQLKVYSELMKNATSQSDRFLLADKAFGKSGDNFVAFLGAGAAALDTMMRKADETGKVIDDKLVKEGADLARRWSSFMEQMSAGWETFVLSIVDGVSSIHDAIQKLPAAQRQALSLGIAGGTNPVGLNGPGGGSSGIGAGLAAAAGAAANGPSQAQRDAAAAALATGLFNVQHAIPNKPTVIPDPGAATAAKKIEDVIKALQLEDENLTRTNRDAAIYNALARAGTTADTARGKVVAELAGKLYDDAQAQKLLNDELEFFGGLAYSAFDELISGGKSFKDVVKDIAVELEHAALKAALLGQGPLAELFGLSPKGGGSVGGLAGLAAAALKGLFGFAEGGEFTIGGGGGTDSRLVAFRGTPGEKVRVTRPGQGDGGGGAPSMLQIHFDSELLRAEIVRVSGPLSIEVYRRGQKASARRQELAG